MTFDHHKSPSRIHLIGIAGEGMTGLAQYLLDLGHTVSGSDLKQIDQLTLIAQLGIEVHSGHRPENIQDIDLVIHSDAIGASNIELIEARIQNIPIISRAQSIEHILTSQTTIFVAGSHGKSTTSAMLATTLKALHLDPSFLIGASAPSLDFIRGHHGSGSFFIGEACEAFQNLIHFNPSIAVITNIDDEHVEQYGSQSRLDKAFIQFANRAKIGVVVYGADPGIGRITQHIDNRIITFGINKADDVSAQEVHITNSGSRFDLYLDQLFIQTIFIPLPGEHIVLDALASIAALKLGNVPLDNIADALAQYQGANRRWQAYDAGAHIRVFDDYAHHPAEIRAIRSAAHAVKRPDERLVIVFQPQLYSRTKRLAQDFAQELSYFDAIYLLEIDGAGESNLGNMSSELLIEALLQMGRVATLLTDSQEFMEQADALIKKNDLVIITGAGNVSGLAKNIADHFQSVSAANAKGHHKNPSPIFQASPVSNEDFISPISNSYAGVLKFFYEQLTHNPDAIAVSDNKGVLSYAQLNRAANGIASYLLSKKIVKGDVIAIQATLSLELIALLIALQKIGAVYLPMDVRLPPKRSAYQAEVSNAAMWICAHTAPEPFTKTPWTYITLDDIVQYCESPFHAPSINEEVCVHITEQDSAYICFTSGSTGLPKGVLISHAALANLAHCAAKQFAINPLSKVIANTSIGFDISLGEIWMTLAGGGQLCLTNAKTPLVGSSLAQFLNRKSITHISITPSVLASVPSQPFPHLQHIISVGEPLTQKTVNLWAHNRHFYNAYGPTEATIYASIANCLPEQTVTLGNPIDRVYLKVIGENQIAIEGEGIGELCIGGVGLMQGYLPLGSEEVFISLDIENSHSEKFYRTGDIVKQHLDGSLEYLHRHDSQIKLNGFRIELEEIEHAILREENITDVVVGIDQSESTSPLLAFVVLSSRKELDWQALKESLSLWLPSQMVPKQFIPIKSIPLTLAGKKDRRLVLSDHKRKKILKKTYCQPRNSIEAQLAEIWKDTLKAEFDISVTEDFQWLGGDSIQFLELIYQLERIFDIEIPPGYFGSEVTIEQLAIKLADLLWGQKNDQQLIGGFANSRVYKGLRDLTARWRGMRIHPSSTIVSHGPQSAKYDLFLCLQNEHELINISRALGNSFRVHGMRSGHLLMKYTPDSIQELAEHYIEELQAIAPKGTLLLGGICQGGAIAIQMAKILISQNYRLMLLLLIDPVRLVPYDQKVAFIYCSKGGLSPYQHFSDGLSRYESLYGKNYTLDLINCEHGTIHIQPQVNALAKLIQSLASDPASQQRPRAHQLEELIEKAKADLHTQSFANAYQEWHHQTNLLSDIQLIANTPFFDEQYYIARLQEAKIDPSPLTATDHFLAHGWKLDLNPSPLFNTVGYQKRYPELLSEGANPLIHYLRQGVFQGKIPWTYEHLLAWQKDIHEEPQSALEQILACLHPWIRLLPDQTVSIYTHSLGHFSLLQYQELISQALTQLGINNEMLNEHSPVDPSSDSISLVIGAHEFFYLADAKDPRKFNFEKLIIVNTAHLNSAEFAKIMPILNKAHYILDTHLQSAATLVQLGFNARFLPIGFVSENALFNPVIAQQGVNQYRLDVAIPRDKTSTRFFSIKRKVDLLWIGSYSERRKQFYQNHLTLFNSFASVVRLISQKGPLLQSHPEAVLPETFVHLALHSKILLNIHQNQTLDFEWQRMMHYGLMQGCCVVTETASKIPGLIPNAHYFEADIQELPELITWLLNTSEGQRQLEKVRHAGYQAAVAQFELSASLSALFDIPLRSNVSRVPHL